MTFKNVTLAFQENLKKIQNHGNKIIVRNSETKELIGCSFKVLSPKDRVYILSNRKNNIFATIAETLWVLGGRNDMEYLSLYLPRAIDFSDDGKTWRAGYGVRLRKWHGVDQLHQVYDLLSKSPTTRRAVMVIFDPSLDFMTSLDIPCNNWIQFLIRDGVIHMNIAIRSCDIIWGFSGINTFEWSVLHELMACWTKSQVGTCCYNISSFHLYDRHYHRANKILEEAKSRTVYDFGISSAKISTPPNVFDNVIEKCFKLEKKNPYWRGCRRRN